MAEWKGTKGDWKASDGIDTDNFNRIEGNIQYNHDKFDEIFAEPIPSTSGSNMFYRDSSFSLGGGDSYGETKKYRIKCGGIVRMRFYAKGSVGDKHADGNLYYRIKVDDNIVAENHFWVDSGSGSWRDYNLSVNAGSIITILTRFKNFLYNAAITDVRFYTGRNVYQVDNLL